MLGFRDGIPVTARQAAREVNRALREMDEFSRPWANMLGPHSAQWVKDCCDMGELPVDVREEENFLLVRADVPGVDKNALTVSMENDVLTISGERHEEEEHEDERFYRHERSFGKFSRSLKIPFGVDESSIKASLANGVLTVRLERKAEAKVRKIRVE